MLDCRDVITRLQKACLRASIEPSHAAAEQLHVQLFLLKIEQIQVGNFELAARRWTQCLAKVDNALVVNIKSRHRKMTFRLLRFFLETDRLAFSIEFDHAVALRVTHLVSKNAGTALDGQSVPVEIEFPVKNVIAEHECGQRVANHWLVVDREKLLADNLGEREKTRPRATGKKNSLFIHPNDSTI